MRGRPRFRPMGIADILDETAELFRSDFVRLMTISAIVEVPLSVLVTVVPFPGQSGTVSTSEAGKQALAFAAALVPLSILLLVLTSLLTGALTIAISESYLGRSTSAASCYRRVLKPRVLLSLIGALVVKYLIVGLPFVLLVMVAAVGVALASMGGGAGGLLVVGLLAVALLAVAIAAGLYLLARTALVESCVVLEGSGVGRSIGRSWRLMRGSVGKGVAVIVIVVLVIMLVYHMISGPTTAVIALRQQMDKPVAAWLFVLHLVVTAIMSTLTAPAYSIASILLYYDMRIRREGFDLELLAEELDARARAFTDEGAAGLAREDSEPHSTPVEQPRPEESS